MAKKVKDCLDVLEKTNKPNLTPAQEKERLDAFTDFCVQMGIDRLRCPAGRLIA